MGRHVVTALIQHGRVAEWLTSLVLLTFAITLALPGNTLRINGYRGFAELGFDEASLSTPLALLACARLAALYVNGAWRRSPLMRAVGAAVGAAVYLMLSVTFAWAWFADDRASLGTASGTYLVLGLFDLLAAYRSGADAGKPRPH